MLNDGDTFEHNGNTFKVSIRYDDDGGLPWENAEGHGTVSDWTKRAKRPGEWILASDRGFHRYYDFQDAMQTAKRDGWDAEPYGTGTKGEKALRAVKADFEYLRRFCNDQWHYVGVLVQIVDDFGDPIDGERESVWGIESDAYAYIEETARDLAEELAARLIPAS